MLANATILRRCPIDRLKDELVVFNGEDIINILTRYFFSAVFLYCEQKTQDLHLLPALLLNNATEERIGTYELDRRQADRQSENVDDIQE